MRRGKTVEAKHLVAPFRQLVNRRAPHGAETADDRVEVIDHHSVLSDVLVIIPLFTISAQMLASVVWSFAISTLFGFAGHEITLSDTVRPDGCFIAIPSSLRSSVDEAGGRMLSRAVYRVRIVLGVASILFCPIPLSHSEAADPCQRILGDWGWFIGGKVRFSQNPHSGTYTVKWQNGFVDTLRLSEDGAQLNGTSSTGVKISGRRTPSAAGTSPAPSSTTQTSNPGTAPKSG